MEPLFKNNTMLWRNGKPLFGDVCCCGCDHCTAATAPPCCFAIENFFIDDLVCVPNVGQGQVMVSWHIAGGAIRVIVYISFGLVPTPPQGFNYASEGTYTFPPPEPSNCGGVLPLTIDVLQDLGLFGGYCDWTNVTMTATKQGDGYLITITGIDTSAFNPGCNCVPVNGAYYVPCD